MSLEFVLAGLAGEDDDKGETQIVEDGFFDGKGNAALVGTEVNAAGGSPTDGVAADGCADAEGKRGRGKRIKHEEDYPRPPKKRGQANTNKHEEKMEKEL